MHVVKNAMGEKVQLSLFECHIFLTHNDLLFKKKVLHIFHLVLTENCWQWFSLSYPCCKMLLKNDQNIENMSYLR